MEDPDPLCCCEYINQQGERAHLLGLLCDCSELDDAVDKVIKGLPVPGTRTEEIMSVLEDRLRIPWKGGARKVRLDIVLPWILVPLNMWISSQSLYCLLFTHGAIMPLMVYTIYRVCLRSVRPQTKFFASWSVATTAYLFCIYQYQIVGFAKLPKIVSPWENLCLIMFLFGAFYSAYTVRYRAWYTLTHLHGHGPSTPDSKKDSNFQTRYCRVCKSYIPAKDHHCVWLDACISEANFYPFISFLFCIFMSLVHGGLLFLTSVCDSIIDFGLWSGGRFALLIPTDCWAFNHRFEGDPGLAFAAGIHCMCLSIPVFMLLFQKSYIACTHRLQFQLLSNFSNYQNKPNAYY